MTNSSDRVDQLSVTKRALFELKELKAKLQGVENEKREPIAILGMACRFPGGIKNSQEYWQLLHEGKDAISEVPGDRWDIDAYYDQNPDTAQKMSTRWGGFLDRIDQFDASFFGISPREAAYMDPQQRLLLEVTWEALENAGLTVEHLADSQTGVFIGVYADEYSWSQFDDVSHITTYSGTGVAHSILAGRISYFFDLHGPSVAIDTACSSSLTALHLACQSLRNKECNTAIVGGVNLILSPLGFVATSKMHMMSGDGRCKTFDARADGYVRGEGCATIVLKRLSDAQAQGDPILALVRGSSINQDGLRNGLTAPNVLSQQAVLRQALRNAGVQPEDVHYLETHGTGTALGDPIEIEALTNIYGKPRTDGELCLLGAVKTNIGHLEAASGMAGLIKAILVLQHKQVPANLHFRVLNPNITLEKTPFHIPTSLQPWPSRKPIRYAGISSFGWSGTNAHVILEAAPASVSEREHNAATSWLLPLSAREPTALKQLAQAYLKYLSEESVPLATIASTASRHRTHHASRLALVAHTTDELKEALDAWIRDEPHRDVSAGNVSRQDSPTLVFVFPGQGSQWQGMGQQLLTQEAVFARTIEACEGAFAPYVSWSLRQVLLDPDPEALRPIEVLQPVLFAMQIGLAALWRHWGIEPNAVIGHSMGEVAAAVVAGALSLEDGARIICRRSQGLQTLVGRGAMLLVELAAEEAQARLAPWQQRVSVAVSNSARSTVLSGEVEALEQLGEQLAREGVFCRWVKVDVASHSPQVEELRAPLLQALEGIAPRMGQLAFYSTVRAERMDGSQLDAPYWMENLRQPVRFAQTVEKLLKYDQSIFLEISPHPILTTSLTECFQEAQKQHVALPSLKRDEDELRSLMRTLATMYTQGYAIDWSKIYSESTYTLLPTYPWQHQRFWLDTDKTDAKAEKRQYTQRARTGEHPLLGTYRVQAASPGNYSWEQSISLEEIDYLKDYAFVGSRLFVESAYIEMALASSAQLWPTGTARVEELQFHRALILFPEAVHTLQCTMTKVAPTHYTFQVFSQEREEEHAPSPETPWQLLASATIRLQTQETSSTVPSASLLMPEELQNTATQILPAQQFYARSRAHGLEYGPLFQGIGRIWKSEGHALADIHLPHALLGDIQQYRLHPVLLNLCFQTLFATIEGSESGHYLPLGARSCIFQTEANPASIAWSYASLKTPTEQDDRSQLEGDVHLLDEQGRSVLSIKGLRLQRVSPGILQALTPQGSEAHSCYELAWHPLSFQQEPTQAPLQDGLWLVFAPAEIATPLLPLLQTPTRQLILIEPGSSDQRLSPNHLRASLADREQAEHLLRTLCPPTSPPCRGILYAWGLLTPPAPYDGDEIAASEQGWLTEAQQAALPLLCLLQALLTRGWRDLPRLWVLTSQSLLLDQESSAEGLVSSPLWGLVRTTMQEHPALHISGIDLPAHPSPHMWRRVAQTVLANGPEDQWRLREHESHVARLLPLRLPPIASYARLCQSEGCYVVTGGLGGLGHLLAQWLIEQGARQLLLLGRRPLDEQLLQQLRDWAEQGVLVRYEVVDVADGHALASILQQARREQGPLRGLFHLAGVLDDATLLNQEEAAWLKVQRPKIAGSWWLHRLTRQDSLDYFVLFSSAASVLGSAGQGNYAAANAFLDALAWYRHGQGQVALSINWGPWSQVGLAAAERQRGERLEHMGIGSLTPEQGMAWLEALLRSELQTVQVGIWPFHLRQWEQSHPAQAQSPLFAALRQRVGEEGQSQETQAQSRIREQLQEMRSEQERQRFLETYLQEQVARILRLSDQKIHSSTPLKTLGLDSLMALELRNALEENLGLRLSATIAWNYPTLRELAAYIAPLMDAISPAHEPSEEESRHSSTSSEFVDQAALELLSDEEVEAALLRQLEQRGY